MRSTTHRLLAVVGNNLLNNEKFDIIVFIDVDKLLKSVSNQSMMDGSSLVIMGQNKNILLSTNDKYEDDLLNDVYLGNGTSLSSSKSDYEYNVKKSDYNGCIYISKIPQGIGNLMALLKINRIIVILAAFVALIMAFILSTYLYRPVKNILALVGTKGSIKEGDSDYNGIYSSIEDVKKENVLVKSQIDLMADDVIRSLFYKLVDDTSNISKLKDQIEKYFTGIFSRKNI